MLNSTVAICMSAKGMGGRRRRWELRLRLNPANTALRRVRPSLCLGRPPPVLTLNPFLSLPSLWIPIVRYGHSPCNSLVLGPSVLSFWHFQRHRRCPFPSWKEDWRGFIWCRFRRYLFSLLVLGYKLTRLCLCARKKVPIS